MKLHFNSYGSESSPTLIILHGLFGSSDNWHSFGQKFGEHFHTFTLDARNHGRSPHSDQFDYQVMAEDVAEFMAAASHFFCFADRAFNGRKNRSAFSIASSGTC